MPTSKAKRSPFIAIEKCIEYIKTHCDLSVELKDIRALAAGGILPTYSAGSSDLVLKGDLLSILPILANRPPAADTRFPNSGQLWSDFPASLSLDKHTRIDILSKSTDIEPVFYSAVRNLISSNLSPELGTQEPLVNMGYVLPVRIFTYSKEIRRFIEEQKQRVKLVGSSRASQFSNSAYYMGSKRALSAFIVEALSSVMPKQGVVVDLMCGSGAASCAFNKIWRTISSDAQEFCRVLALVQGGGFSIVRAQNMLVRLLPLARNHAQKLRERMDTFLEAEDNIFHGDLGPALLEEYQKFIAGFPTIPNGSPRGGWDPILEVKKRRKQATLLPYCLFTTYFANVYFGLRQSVEIDSIRFAIDQFESQHERNWALGTLVATMSALGTSYAGHFAQPVKLNLGNLSWILERRAYSIIHEFSVRLLNLAEESEKSASSIELVPGPWSKALSSVKKVLGRADVPVAIYLDAPYKREEYSRYYHVLETAIVYSYPSCIGNGKIPDKRTGERFQSEFFTRSDVRLNQLFVKVITQILNRGWICAWSYSESGNADMIKVIDETHNSTGCWVKSYAAPYQHKAQSGRGAKDVTEYLVVFTPSVHPY